MIHDLLRSLISNTSFPPSLLCFVVFSLILNRLSDRCFAYCFAIYFLAYSLAWPATCCISEWASFFFFFFSFFFNQLTCIASFFVPRHWVAAVVVRVDNFALEERTP